MRLYKYKPMKVTRDNVDYYITCWVCHQRMKVSLLWAIRLVRSRYCLAHLPIEVSARWRF